MKGGSVTAITTRNCARESVIRYTMDQGALARYLEELPAGTVHVRGFSKILPGALDHFEAKISGLLALAGVVGGQEIVARFSASGAKVEMLVAAFELSLRRMGCGRVLRP